MFSAYSRLTRIARERVIFGAVFCVSLFLFYPISFHVGHDLASYLAVAKNFVAGNGMIDIQGDVSNHRFGYKLLLAGALWLGRLCGNEMFFVILMQAMFSTLSAVLCYALAFKLFDRFTALLAWGLFILCPVILSSLVEFGLDGVWPAFCLASLLLFLKCADAPFESQKAYGYMLLSGVFAALAVWVKESTGLNYALIPFILIFTLNLDAKFRRMIVFYAMFMVVLYFGSLVIGVLGDVLGQDSLNERKSFQSAIAYAGGAYNDNGFISSILFVLDGWRGYFFAAPFSMNIHQFFPVFFMFYIAVVFAVWQMIRGPYRRSYIILCTVICVYLPYAAWAAQWHMRNVQLVLLFVVFSVMIAHCLVSSQRMLWREGQKGGGGLKASFYKGLSIVLICVILFTQFFSSNKSKFYLDDNEIVNKVIALANGQFAAKFDDTDLRLAQVVLQQTGNIPRVIMTDSVVPASALSFYAPRKVKTQINLYKRIMIGVHENPYIPYYETVGDSDTPAFACVVRPADEQGKRHAEIMVFDVVHFMAQIRMHDPLYVLVKRGLDCTPYFTDWLAENAETYGVRYKELSVLPRTDYLLLRLESDAHADFTLEHGVNNVKMSKNLQRYLAYMHQHDSYSYRYYSENFPFLRVNMP